MPTDHQRLIENGYVAVKHWRHGLMMYNVNDTFIGRSLDIYGEWCESELTVLGQLIRPGDIVVDVGANIGTHTVYFANAVGPMGVVHAVEPQRIAYQFLCANVALNALINVRCLNVGFGAEPGSVMVPVLNPTTEQNFGALRLGNFDQGELVDVMTLDRLDLGGCRLVKIDVEGVEKKVLAGAMQTIERYRPALFVENNTVERSREIIEAIQGLGYRCWWHIASYFSPSNYFNNTENVFARFQPEANLLCFHHDTHAEVAGLVSVEGPDDDWRKALQRKNAPQSTV
jgi:FkbM family methyltransferase